MTTNKGKPVIAQRGTVKILFPSVAAATELIGLKQRAIVAFWAEHELTRHGWVWRWQHA